MGANMKGSNGKIKVSREAQLLDVLLGIIALCFGVLAADSMSLYYVCIELLGQDLFWIVAVALPLIAFVLLLKNGFFQLFKIPSRNSLDNLFLVIFASSIVLFGLDILLGYLLPYKKIALLVGVAISGLLMSLRCVQSVSCRKRNRLKSSGEREIVDLQNFLESEIEPSDEPLIFAEEAVEYDLLGRNSIVDTIFKSILSCNYSHAYTIGVTGKWGSGKTTILNVVKERIDLSSTLKYIDNFDPWFFGNQEALISAMYEEILYKAGIKYSFSKNRKILKSLLSIATDKFAMTDFFNYASGLDEPYETVKNVKHMIADYLEKRNETIVFFIDNLDRADSESILLLFKLLGTIFDIKHVIYVLAYDKERISEILEEQTKINPLYMEKVIQQEITIPDIPRKRFEEICEKCLGKVLEYYGVKEENLEQFRSSIELISRKTTNLRQFKRLLNTVFISCFMKEDGLYKPHVLGIEVIRFFDLKLYNELKEKREYLAIDYRLQDSYDALFEKPGDETTKKIKEVCNGICDSYPDYLNILTDLFIPISKTLEGRAGASLFSSEYRDVASISDSMYIDLFFVPDELSYTRVKERVTEMISEVEAGGKLKENLRSLVLGLQRDEKKIFIEVLLGIGTNIINGHLKEFTICLYESIDDLDIYNQFIGSGCLERISFVITRYLNVLSNSEQKEVLEMIAEKFDFSMLNELSKSAAFFRDNSVTDYSMLCGKIQHTIASGRKRVFDEKIDVLSEQYYRRGNIRGLEVDTVEYNEEKIGFNKYLKAIVSPENVYKLILEYTNEGKVLGGYRYTLSRHFIDIRLGDKKIVDNLILQAGPQNETEEIIAEMWGKSKLKPCRRFAKEPLLLR